MNILHKIQKWLFRDWKTLDKMPKWAVKEFNQQYKKRGYSTNYFFAFKGGGTYYIRGKGVTYKVVVKNCGELGWTPFFKKLNNSR